MLGIKKSAAIALFAFGFLSAIFATPVTSQPAKPTLEAFEEAQIDALLRGTQIDAAPLRAKMDKFIRTASLKQKKLLLDGKTMIPWEDPTFPKKKKFTIGPPNIDPVASICPDGSTGPGCQTCKPKPPICHKHVVTCTRKKDSDPPDCTESHTDCIEGTGTTC